MQNCAFCTHTRFQAVVAAPPVSYRYTTHYQKYTTKIQSVAPEKTSQGCCVQGPNILKECRTLFWSRIRLQFQNRGNTRDALGKVPGLLEQRHTTWSHAFVAPRHMSLPTLAGLTSITICTCFFALRYGCAVRLVSASDNRKSAQHLGSSLHPRY